MDKSTNWGEWVERVTDAAQQVWDSGRTYHLLRLDIASQGALFVGTSEKDGDDVPAALQAVESAGWKLDPVGCHLSPARHQEEFRGPV